MISVPMAQKPKKKKKRNLLPKDIAGRPDHEIMERVLGKRVMKEVDKIVEERSEESENKED